MIVAGKSGKIQVQFALVLHVFTSNFLLHFSQAKSIHSPLEVVFHHGQKYQQALHLRTFSASPYDPAVCTFGRGPECILSGAPPATYDFLHVATGIPPLQSSQNYKTDHHKRRFQTCKRVGCPCHAVGRPATGARPGVTSPRATTFEMPTTVTETSCTFPNVTQRHTAGCNLAGAPLQTSGLGPAAPTGDVTNNSFEYGLGLGVRTGTTSWTNLFALVVPGAGP
ncbi:hypothetical protein LY76DRAFT_642831 [Colletotrichum caudatum]|nr:hypothetical protein LY76DRAFT_642831 [Colletotrichum caudatum]